jgi:hypothetical protein
LTWREQSKLPISVPCNGLGDNGLIAAARAESDSQASPMAAVRPKKASTKLCSTKNCAMLAALK